MIKLKFKDMFEYFKNLFRKNINLLTIKNDFKEGFDFNDYIDNFGFKWMDSKIPFLDYYYLNLSDLNNNVQKKKKPENKELEFLIKNTIANHYILGYLELTVYKDYFNLFDNNLGILVYYKENKPKNQIDAEKIFKKYFSLKTEIYVEEIEIEC